MAKIFPNNLDNLKVSPTLWEKKILSILAKLPDDYEVFFNAYLNTLRPDIVILRKGYWAMIIEVKDWNLSQYTFSNGDYWLFNNPKNWKSYKKVSPSKQVMKYKNELYDVCIWGLLLVRIQNKLKTNKDSVFGMISTGVFMYWASREQVQDIISSQKTNKSYIYNKVLSEKTVLDSYLIKKENSFFSEEIYNEFKRFLQPNQHVLEQWIKLDYTERQKELMASRPWQQKISWFPWSWKTIILAQRASNALKRHEGRVLVLTYNITLIRYIEQKIKNSWWDLDMIIVSNYHQFIWLTWRVSSIADYDKIPLFESNENKYETIFIDEIQDYKKEWIQIVKKCFLKENGEFVVFWDEKQNIYTREMDTDKKPYTWVSWNWNKLESSFRVENDIGDLANRFQKEFFSGMYEYDEIPTKQLSLLNSAQKKCYINYHSLPSDAQIASVYEIILNSLQKLGVHNDDVCVLWTKIEEMRQLDKYIRDMYEDDISRKCITTFETQEMYEAIQANDFLYKNQEEQDADIKSIRRNKKIGFHVHSWAMKISTIHSFKWWEVDTVFLVIDTDEDSHELIYTGITRAKQNLIVINLWNSKYEDFFTNYKIYD